MATKCSARPSAPGEYQNAWLYFNPTKKMNEKSVLKRFAETMKQNFPLFHSDLPHLYFSLTIDSTHHAQRFEFHLKLQTYLFSPLLLRNSCSQLKKQPKKSANKPHPRFLPHQNCRLLCGLFLFSSRKNAFTRCSDIVKSGWRQNTLDFQSINQHC